MNFMGQLGRISDIVTIGIPHATSASCLLQPHPQSIHMRIPVLLTLLTVAVASTGQVITGQSFTCGADARHRHKLRTDPAYVQRMAGLESAIRDFDMSARDAGTLFVPVVVHVLETGTALTAITDDQVRDGIRWLNERYRKVAGTAGAGNGVDTQIEFALAVRDPSGACTSGITRHNMTGNATYMASGVFGQSAGITDAQVKVIGTWDQNRYYNIWLVSEFDNNNGGSGLQGYAYFAGSHGQPEDGTVMLVNAYKNPSGSTLAHELGHAFNLYHTFEGDADGAACPTNASCSTQGDLVCDTPPHIRSASDCNTGGTNACDGGTSNALFKNNYMDYSGDVCQNMFTAGQNVRVQAALTVTRASFLAANGNLALVPAGTPVLDFSASKALLCGTGQTVQLFDRSTCVPNTYLQDPDLPGSTFAWILTNGSQTLTSDKQNPVFTLNSTGVYNATLQITQGSGTWTRTENGIVVVAAAPVTACTPTTGNAGNFAQTVNNVVFNTISNATSTVTNAAYTDFSCTRNTVLATGGTYPVSVTIRAGGSAVEVVSGYIDYNNNGVFEDPAELVVSGSAAVNTTNTINANVTVPGGAVTNTLLRMRIYGEAGTLSASERSCSAALFVGDVEDYGVYITGSQAAVSIAAAPGSTITYGTSVTFTPTPVNGGAQPDYQWFRNGVPVASGPTYQRSDLLPGETVKCEMFSNLAGVIASPATSNTVTMTVTGPPLSDFSGSATRICSGGTVSFTDLSQLSPTSWSWTFPGGTPAASTAQNPTVTYGSPGVYSVTLVASNANGAGTTATRTGYITVHAAPATSCTVTRSTSPTAGIGITNVTLSTINNTTVFNDAAMNNFTCTGITTLTPGTSYAISVTVGSFNSQWVRAYIDYNNDGDFVDANEAIFSPANGSGIRSGTFTTPAAPPLMNTLLRMRVITDFLNTAPGPCTTPVQYGQVEEYGVVLVPLPGVQVGVRAFLEAAYNASTGLMSDNLRSLGLVPTTEPYTALGYTYVGATGGTTTAGVLGTSGNNAIVDWVVVELRDNSTPATIVASRAALLQCDGDVVALDGTSPVSFTSPAGTYRVAIRHRNHLPAMTLNGVALTGAATTVDLGSAATATFGAEARKAIAGTFPASVLWMGDVLFNGDLQYVGANNDRDLILTTVGSTAPNNVVTNTYSTRDVNMDGSVKYVGLANDRDPILLNVGNTMPNSIRQAQLP